MKYLEDTDASRDEFLVRCMRAGLGDYLYECEQRLKDRRLDNAVLFGTIGTELETLANDAARLSAEYAEIAQARDLELNPPMQHDPWRPREVLYISRSGRVR